MFKRPTVACDFSGDDQSVLVTLRERNPRNLLQSFLLGAVALSVFSQFNVYFASGLSLLVALGHWLWKRSTIVEESLLAVRHLGIQISKKNAAGSAVKRRFVSQKSIKEIYVLEGFTASRVIVYLAIELKRGDKLVVPFEFLNPPSRTTGEIMMRVREILGLSDD